MPAGLQFVKYKLVEPLWMLDLINGRTQNVQAGQYSSWRQNDNYQTLQVVCKQQMGVFPKLTNPTLSNVIISYYSLLSTLPHISR